jgi:hypothetical protein
VSLGEIAGVVGPIADPPTAVESLEDLTPSPAGETCVYRLTRRPQSQTIVLSVLLTVGGQTKEVLGMLANLFARELGDTNPMKSNAPPSPSAKAGWDDEGPILIPSYTNAFGGRQGHIGIVVASQGAEVPIEILAALAATVRDHVPDLPIALPPDPILAQLDLGEEDPKPAQASPDPCRLLTREEAQGVLGKLSAAPYRSNGSTPLATPSGDSCSYYTAGHHALVLRPEWNQGRALFQMAAGVPALAGRALGEHEANPADTLEGPWDQVNRSWTTGSLYFLKGDRMLELVYATSGTDLLGAVRLARAAVARL